MSLVACYVRVSTQEQTENYSIGEQISRLKAYCKAKDLKIYDTYIDNGYSGSNINRPAIKKMIKDLKQNKFNIILVYKLDRLSRSQKDTLYLIEDIFLKNNIEFMSITENIDTSNPYGRAMIGILSAFAQLEREQIKERMLMGRYARAKEGKFHGGKYIPIGYDYKNGELIINDYEAEQVRKIFEMHLKGYSIHSIQKYMKEHYTNKYSNWNSHISILNCLKNNVYTGKIKFENEVFTGSHKPIITEKDFLKTQQYLCKNSPKNHFKASQMLSGLLICGNCSSRYYCNHGKYTCYSVGKSVKKYINNNSCNAKKWGIEELNQIIINNIKIISNDKRFIEFNKKINLLDNIDALDTGTIEEQRLFLKSIIKDIYIYNTEIIINWKFM